MRKIHLIILVIFIIISALFYTPVKERLFYKANSTNVLNKKPALLTTLNESEFKLENNFTTNWFVTDTTVLLNYGVFFKDSLTSFSTQFIEIKDRDLIFNSQFVLPYKKSVQFKINPLSDFVQIICQTDTGMQKFEFNNVQNQLKIITFNNPKNDFTRLKISVTGKVRISLPLVNVISTKNLQQKNQSTLFIDLPSETITELQKLLSSNQWSYQELNSLSNNQNLALGNLLSGQSSDLNNSLPQKYASLVTRFSTNPNSNWLTNIQNNSQTIFAGVDCPATEVVKKVNFFHETILAKENSYDETWLYELFPDDNNRNNNLMYFYYPNKPQLDLLTAKINELLKKVTDISIVLLSSQTSHPAKTPLLFSKNSKTGNIILQQFNDSNVIKKSYIKVITFYNQSRSAKNFQLQIRSDLPFSLLDDKIIKNTKIHLFDLSVPAKKEVQTAILYENSLQQFNYSCKENYSALYGSICLPVGNIDEFEEKSVLTEFSEELAKRSKADIRIENFLILPLWRYAITF